MKNFEINHRKTGAFDVLELYGELDAHTVSKFEDALLQLLDQNRYQIIVNCKNLNYIASAGLGVFMAYIEEVRMQGGDIKLSNLNSRVYNVFDLLGFPSLYDIFEKESEAIQNFKTD